MPRSRRTSGPTLSHARPVPSRRATSRALTLATLILLVLSAVPSVMRPAPAGADTGSPPAVPTLLSPANGTTYGTSPTTPTLSWSSVAGATNYQVVINDGGTTSPWVTGTSWSPGSLGNGQYAWQVRATNSAGTSSLSPKWVFWVDPSPGSNPTPTPTATSAPQPSLARTPYQGVVGTSVAVTVSNFGPNESVTLNWDTSNGPTLGTVKTNASGTGTTNVTIPAASNGWHDYTGYGQTSGKRAWGAIQVLASLGVSPASGKPGDSIAVSAKGFPAGQSITVGWNRTSSAAGTTVCSGTTDGGGSFACSFAIPSGAGAASYPVVATTSDGTSAGASVGVAGPPAVTISPGSGQTGTAVTVGFGGFAANETVNLSWDGGGTWMAPTADGSGAGSVRASVPYLANGTRTLTAKGASSGRSASATYAVQSSFSLSPAVGAAGTSVTAYANGFSAGSAISILWNRTSSSNGTTVCSGTVAGNGNYSCTFNVPGGTASGSYPVVASNGGVTGNASFQVQTQAQPSTKNGGTIVGPGTYLVTGTDEGMVGDSTSNGHTITPMDHFVSLPACTATSCPWLTPGQKDPTVGYVTACGDNCYVRVTNPSTGACSVAPIYDVGPWFTNDDWWNATAVRNLNNLPTTVNILAQGYTGADAARDGLNVGYGVSSGGIGISNKQYEVGNRSAIDLADGTWSDIGYSLSQGIGQVQVTMLWQSGENPSSAASACGRSLNGPTPTPTPKPGVSPTPTPTGGSGSPALARTPVQGPVGTSISVTASGFGPNESVKLTWDDETGPLLGTIKTNASGTGTTTITIPAATTGWHDYTGYGQTSGKRAWGAIQVLSGTAPTPTPTATPKPSPTNTPTPTISNASLAVAPDGGTVGTNISVTASGFGANESVKLTWNTVRGSVLGTIQTNGSGSGTTTVAIPSAVTGWHNVIGVGQTSRQRGQGKIQVLPRVSPSPSSVSPGDNVTVEMAGFPARSRASVSWGDGGATLCRGLSSGQGRMTCTFTVPSDAVNGDNTVSGTAGGVTAQAKLTVTGASSRFLAPQTVSGTSADTVPTATPTPGDTSALTGAMRALGQTTNVLANAPTATATATLTAPATAGSAAAGEPSVFGQGDNPPAATATPTDIAKAVLTQVAAQVATAMPTATPTGAAAWTDVPTATPTAAAADESVGAPTPIPTDTPTTTPTVTPTPIAQAVMTQVTSQVATISAMAAPTSTPTAEPTDVPTELPTEEPTTEPTVVPTEEPAVAEAPAPTEGPAPSEQSAPAEPQTVQIAAAASGSVSAAQPDAALPGPLLAGGADGDIAFITFQIGDLPAGTVTSAKLVLTGSGDGGGSGGDLGVLPGVGIDPGGLTYNDAPAHRGEAALTAGGAGVWIDSIAPGNQTVLDVTGTVSGAGTLTFVIAGTPDAAVGIAGADSGSPPLLVIEITPP